MSPWRVPVTMVLVAISILVYAMMQLWDLERMYRMLIISQYYQPILPEIRDGQVWRLISPIFMHFGIFHIVFNLLWTWQLGGLIEYRQGSLMLLIICLMSAIISNLAQYWIVDPRFGGMSGVVYALFGYVWIQGHTNPKFGVRLHSSIVQLMLGWFVICWTGLLERLFGLSVANTAHAAGLACGVLFALVVSFMLPGRIKRNH